MRHSPVEIVLQDGLYPARPDLVPRPHVLDKLVRLEHIRADLRPPRDLGRLLRDDAFDCVLEENSQHREERDEYVARLRGAPGGLFTVRAVGQDRRYVAHTADSDPGD